jgi:hypothetical protein
MSAVGCPVSTWRWWGGAAPAGACDGRHGPRSSRRIESGEGCGARSARRLSCAPNPCVKASTAGSISRWIRGCVPWRTITAGLETPHWGHNARANPGASRDRDAYAGSTMRRAAPRRHPAGARTLAAGRPRRRGRSTPRGRSISAVHHYGWTDQKLHVHTFCCMLAFLLLKLRERRQEQRAGLPVPMHGPSCVRWKASARSS